MIYKKTIGVSMHKSHYNCVYSVTYHLVLPTKGNIECLNESMIQRLEALVNEICDKSYLQVEQFKGTASHIHIIINAHPNVMPSKFVTSLKTVTSRYIRKEFGPKLEAANCKTGLWARGYGLFTAGLDTDRKISEYLKAA